MVINKLKSMMFNGIIKIMYILMLVIKPLGLTLSWLYYYTSELRTVGHNRNIPHLLVNYFFDNKKYDTASDINGI